MGLISWISSGVLKGILDPLTGLAEKALDSKVAMARVGAEVSIESMHADIELNKLKKDMNQMYQGWWVTRWIVPGFAYPLIIWWGAIVFDSVFPHLFEGWNVAALPGPLQDWAGQIILSFFLVRGIELFTNPLRGIVTATFGQKIVEKVKSAFGGTPKKGVRRGRVK